jgi:type I restriction-modification system DNA methylase subunit
MRLPKTYPLCNRYMPEHQQRLMATLIKKGGESKEEGHSMLRDVEESLQDIETVPASKQGRDTVIVQAHYFYNTTRWFVLGAEVDDEDDQVYLDCFVVLNGDTEMAERGSVLLSQIIGIGKPVELDFYWNKPTLAQALHEKYPNEFEPAQVSVQPITIMLLSDYKDLRDKQDKLLDILEKKLNAYPRGPMGLVAESVRLSDEYILVNTQFKKEFKKLQELNKLIVKMTPKGERKSKYADVTANITQAYALNRQIEGMITNRGTDTSAYTPAEKMQLLQYSGMGGLEYAGATGKGLLYEYFTPTQVVRKMWALALKHGYQGGQVLEPSAGNGMFLQQQPAQAPSIWTTYEINPTSAAILSICWPNATNYHQYFEQRFIERNKSIGAKGNKPTYDLVIGNPPYGDVQGTAGSIYFNMGERTYSKAKSYDEYFILRGLDVLKPGGLLIYVIGAEVANGGKLWLDKDITPCKEIITQRADLIDAYRLPNGIFERTDVVSDIVVFKRK